jgi:hypothetical protein
LCYFDFYNFVIFIEEHNADISIAEADPNFEDPLVDELYSDLFFYEDMDALRLSQMEKPDPLFKLGAWAVKHELTDECVNELLYELAAISKIKLPKSSKTLKHTSRKRANIQKMGDGEFIYFGIKPWLERVATPNNIHKLPECLELTVNMDGFKINDATVSESWPIQAKLNSVEFFFKPFVVAMYYGPHKPPLEEYLKAFCDELLDLSANGFKVGEIVFKVKIKMLVLDAPAKAYILNIIGHTGYYSCNKCCQKGEYQDNVYFPFDETLMECRNNESFKMKTQQMHHHGASPLEVLDIGMVSDVPNDYMHSVCIGVMKWLIQHWNKLLPKTKDRQLINEINVHLEKVKSETPAEFSRKPRPITTVAYWKSLEFRSFILYYGPLVMKNRLPDTLYQHFMYFAVAIRILADPCSTHAEIDYANDLLFGFVSDFKLHYPINKITYNIHSLLHIAEDVKRFGPLDNFSAFDFENNMQYIRSMVSRYDQPLPQISKRKGEREYFFEEIMRPKVVLETILGKPLKRSLNILLIDAPFDSVSFKNLKFSTVRGNNFCFLNEKYFEISAITVIQNVPTLIGKFIDVISVFDDPICSSRIGIVKKIGYLSADYEYLPVTLITTKIFQIKCSNEIVLVKFL